jgi:hypothetical protein
MPSLHKNPKKKRRHNRPDYSYSAKDFKVRALIPLTEKMVKALDRLQERCMEACGHHVDRTQLVRSLIAAVGERDAKHPIEFGPFKTEKDLVKFFRKMFMRT